MSIREVTYYQVACDEPGCDVKTGDSAEYTAWASADDARDDWTDGEGIVLDDGRTFCVWHIIGKRCAGCDYLGSDLTEAEGDYWCPKCLPEATS